LLPAVNLLCGVFALLNAQHFADGETARIWSRVLRVSGLRTVLRLQPQLAGGRRRPPQESDRRNSMTIQLWTILQRQRRVMRDFVITATLLLGAFASEPAFSQGVSALPQHGAGRPGPTTCLILERAGTVHEVTSRVLSLGLHQKQFQYVEGKLPSGLPFHDNFTERDVRDLQTRGVEVVILSSDLMPDELQQARDYCRAEIRETPAQPTAAQVEIASTPSGSDIEVDGKFIGSTPSSVKLPLGEHTIKLSKNGFETWERTITTVAGSVRISPDLEPLVPAHDSTGETATNLQSAAGKEF
jgi:PEGA domain